MEVRSKTSKAASSSSSSSSLVFGCGQSRTQRVVGKARRGCQTECRVGTARKGNLGYLGGRSTRGNRASTSASREGKVRLTKTVIQEPELPRIQAGQGGPNYSLVNTALLCVATISFVVTSLSFKKSLRMFDQTCIDTMEAMKATEKASKEVEIVSLQLEREIPVTLVAIENASLEVEELSKSLQSLTGSVNRNIRQPVQDAVTKTVDTSTNVMRRVPNDLQYVSEVATMALGEWRARLGDTIGSFEKLRKGSITTGQEEAIDWIEAWKLRTAALESDSENMDAALDNVEKSKKSTTTTTATTQSGSSSVVESNPRKEMAVNKVSLALSAAEEAAALAEVASGRLEKAMAEYTSSLNSASYDSDSYDSDEDDVVEDI